MLLKAGGNSCTTSGQIDTWKNHRYNATNGSSYVGTTTYAYTYDDRGNIASVTKGGSTTTTYVYDSKDQLTRENNQAAGKTWVYTYDDGGNIKTKKEYDYTTGSVSSLSHTTKTYTYDDSTWKDLLTKYNGTTLSYDNIGNLTGDGTWTYTWEHGRQLAGMSKSGATISYAYNADGQRISKTVNGTTTQYNYAGGRLTQMKKGSNILHFDYDALGPSVVRYAGVDYYYHRNAQGDITAISDVNGAMVVKYTYDAWGNVLTTTGTMASTLGALNPLRYRGYVYDTETGLYYLNSRYYNPSWGRFINADTPEVATLSPGSATWDKNLFAYCDNNPVMRTDDGGHFWHLVIGGIIGGLIGGISAAASGGDLGDIVIGALFGAAGGVLSASGAGVVVQAIGSAGIAMASNAATQIKDISNDKTGQKKFDVVDMLFDGAVGLATGYLGGNGASYGNTKGINASWKQLSKRGFFDKGARAYFEKTAHRAGGDYVKDALLHSMNYTKKGAAIITVKNWAKTAMGWI